MADTLFTRVHLAAISRSNAVNDTIAKVLSCTLVSVSVLAELNLIRLFVTNWRESQREQATRRLRATATGQSKAPTLGIGRSRRAGVALLCGVIPSAALAQQSSPSPASSTPVSPSQDQRKLSTDATLTPPSPVTSAETSPMVISTDRPSFSDTTGIAPVGRLQLETGYTFTLRNREGVETQRHNGPELLARVGLLNDRLELRATTSGYVWSRTNDGTGSGFSSSEGFNDVALGFKLKLTDQDDTLPRLVFEGITTVGAGSRDVSTRRVEPTAKVIWSYDLEKLWGDQWKGFGVYGNFNLAYPTTNGDRFLQGAASICGTYAINDKLGVFAEYYVVGPAAKDTDSAHSIDFGTTYLLNNRIQFDARVGFGLDRTADNVYAGVGIGFLF
jgi:hypothetical protein